MFKRILIWHFQKFVSKNPRKNHRRAFVVFSYIYFIIFSPFWKVWKCKDDQATWKESTKNLWKSSKSHTGASTWRIGLTSTYRLTATLTAQQQNKSNSKYRSKQTGSELNQLNGNIWSVCVWKWWNVFEESQITKKHLKFEHWFINSCSP